MLCKTRVARSMTLASMLALSGCISAPDVPRINDAVTMPGGIVTTTVPFTFDDNRIFVPLTFIKPDGSERKVMAFVNMGSVGPVLSPALYRELGVYTGHAVTFRIGGRIGGQTIRASASAVQTTGQSSSFRILLNPFAGPMKPEKETAAGQDMMAQLSGPLHVEAILPSGVLKNFDVAFDYGARTLTLAPQGTLPHDGTPLPFRLNPNTGFVTVDASFGGTRHAVVIDNGGSYTVFRSDVVAGLAKAHPDLVVSDTAIGEANLTGSMADVGAPVLKIPDAALGPVAIAGTGIAGIGMGSMFTRMIQGFFWDFYDGKAGEPVDAWIGGNVLKDFRITLDYAQHMSYWQRQRQPVAHELDLVGITLERVATGYVIAAIANKNGKPTVADVQVGDVLVRIDGITLVEATRGQIFAALHGAPGEHKTLLIGRDGKRVTVDAAVTAF